MHVDAKNDFNILGMALALRCECDLSWTLG